MVRLLLGFVCFSLMLTVGQCAEPLKSGLQAGDKVSEFSPLNVTGTEAGEKVCRVCEHGTKPVAAIFVREMTPGVKSLIKKIDDATKANATAKMGSFVIVMTDDDKQEEALRKVAEKEKLKKIVLCIDSPKGPENWKISKDANVTVVLYVKHTVKENFAFAKDVDEKEADRIVEKLASVLPVKEEKKDK